jgi:uncharacterized protein
MRGLFSFLFGASILLVIERAEAKGESAARVHYARMVWLLLFGLAHLWLVWWGDILNLYALIGMIAFAFRKRRVRTLVLWGLALVFIECMLVGAMSTGVYVSQIQLGSPDPKVAADAAKTLEGFNKGFGVPSADALAANLAQYRGSYATILAARFKEQMFNPLFSVALVGWETLGYMLFGMAALKSGMLTGGWTPGRYRKWMLICFAIALAGYAAIATFVTHEQFSLFAVISGAMGMAAPLRPFAFVGWACLIILLARSGGAIQQRIAAAGRMAFTNYLMTSLVCTTLFYGYGFGLYGHLSRWQLYLVVFGVWALMLLWSKPWLARFRYGPFEWLWRSLSRGRFEKLRGAATE